MEKKYLTEKLSQSQNQTHSVSTYRLHSKNVCRGLHRLIDDENLSIKVVKPRITKHGDFRKSNNQKCIITINKSNNKYRFLMTLIHEIAHYYTYKENKFAKPHGIKWKTMFKNISKPFLNNKFSQKIYLIPCGNI